jgi:TatA/E family protein of Tat protein translocase
MFSIGGWEMLLIAVVALLVFGPKRLPELARSLGRGLAELRRASNDLRRSVDFDLDTPHLSSPDPEKQPPAQAAQGIEDTPAPGPSEAKRGGGEEQQGEGREQSEREPVDPAKSDPATKRENGSSGDTGG